MPESVRPGVRLWKTTGTLLATAVVPVNPNPVPGWQEVRLSTPVSISAGQIYVASYYTPSGSYAFVNNGLSNGFTTANLTAVAGSANNGNGVYRYGTGGGFPNQSFQNSNYFVDVVFVRTP